MANIWTPMIFAVVPVTVSPRRHRLVCCESRPTLRSLSIRWYHERYAQWVRLLPWMNGCYYSVPLLVSPAHRHIMITLPILQRQYHTFITWYTNQLLNTPPLSLPNRLIHTISINILTAVNGQIQPLMDWGIFFISHRYPTPHLTPASWTH